jgi:pimeloyl-ACP methyl ester carboxylesterase
MDTVTSSDGTRIAYDVYGTGPAVVLVGGAFQHRAIDEGTAKLARIIAERGFTVHHYDRRGRGDSTDTPPYAVDREIDDLEAVISRAGGSAHVFGMSSGAVLAVLAAARGLPITRLGLYEPPVNVTGRPAVADDYTERLEAAIAEDRRGDAVAQFMTEAVGTPPEMVAQFRQAPFFKGLEAVAPTLAYDNTIMGLTLAGGPLAPEPWNQVKVPALVGVGGASDERMQSGARAVAAALPHATLVTLPDQTHQVDPALLGPALADFYAAA